MVTWQQVILPGYSHRFAALAVAPDSSWLATRNWEGRVRIWDPATGRERATLTGHIGEVAALAVAPNGSWLASGGRDYRVRIGIRPLIKSKLP